MQVTEYNVGRWCLSEDECIAQGIDFAAYERGVADAAKAFRRNAAAVPMSQKTQDGHSVSSVAEAPTTPLPLFAVGVARRKWESLQADGYRMQRIEFARSIDGQETRGIIDPWGKVLWNRRSAAGDQPSNGHGPESAGTQSDTERDAATALREVEGYLACRLDEQDFQTCVRAATTLRDLISAAMGNQSAGKEGND